jgi:hypothetical protein
MIIISFVGFEDISNKPDMQKVVTLPPVDWGD